MTKKKIAWVMDSAGISTEIVRNHPDVYVIPLSIHFGNEQFRDGIDLTPEQFYERLKAADMLPKTSQAPAGEFASLYEKLGEEYEGVISVHIASTLSGTYQSAAAGAEMVDIPVECIDTLTVASGQNLLIERGMELEKSGLTMHEIAEQLRSDLKKFHNFIIIGNLNQLYKGGRMNSVQFFLGSLLQVKPIIQVNEQGELLALEKVRSLKKAVAYMVDKVVTAASAGNVKKVEILHGHVGEQAEAIKQSILQQVPGLEIEVSEISPVLAVHAGEGSFAVMWYDN